jgi:hypothetical protein
MLLIGFLLFREADHEIAASSLVRLLSGPTGRFIEPDYQKIDECRYLVTHHSISPQGRQIFKGAAYCHVIVVITEADRNSLRAVMHQENDSTPYLEDDALLVQGTRALQKNSFQVLPAGVLFLYNLSEAKKCFVTSIVIHVV